MALALLAAAGLGLAAGGSAAARPAPARAGGRSPHKRHRAPSAVDVVLSAEGRFTLTSSDSFQEPSSCVGEDGNPLYVTNSHSYEVALDFSARFKKIHIPLPLYDVRQENGKGSLSGSRWKAEGQGFSETLTNCGEEGPQLYRYSCSGAIADRTNSAILTLTAFGKPDDIELTVAPYISAGYQPEGCLTTDGSSINVENITNYYDPQLEQYEPAFKFLVPDVKVNDGFLLHSGTRKVEEKAADLSCAFPDNPGGISDECTESSPGSVTVKAKTLKVYYR